MNLSKNKSRWECLYEDWRELRRTFSPYKLDVKEEFTPDVKAFLVCVTIALNLEGIPTCRHKASLSHTF